MMIRKKTIESQKLLIVAGIVLTALLATSNLNNVKAQESVQPYTVIARPGVTLEDASLNMPAKIRLFESSNGIRLETPQGYQISFALKNGERVFFFRKDFFNAPEVIHRSSDSLAIQATPRGGTEVVVMISSSAYNQLDIGFRVENISTSANTWHLYAFIHDRQGLNNISYIKGDVESDTRFTAQSELRVETSGLPAQFRKDTARITFSSAEPANTWGSYPTVGPLNDDPTLAKTFVEDAPVLKGNVTSSTEDGPFDMMVYPKNRFANVITSKGDSTIIRSDSLFITELGHFDQSILDNLDSLTIKVWSNGMSGTRTIDYQADVDTLYTNIELNSTADISAPQQLSASTSNQEFDQVFLDWDGVEGAKEYIIYRDSTSSGRFDSLATTANQAYFDSGLEKYAEWTYIVAPVDSSGQIGQPSYEVKKDIPPPPAEPPVSLFRDVDDDTLDNEIYEHANEAIAFHYELAIGGGELKQRNISVRLDSIGGNTSQTSDKTSKSEISRDRISSTETNSELTGFLLDVVEQNTINNSEGNRYLTSDRWSHPKVYFWNYLALPTIASFDPSYAGDLFMNVLDRQRESGMIPSRLLQENDTAPAEPLVGRIALETSNATPDSSLFSETEWERIYNIAKAHYNYWNDNFDSDGDSLLERHYYPVYVKLGTIPESLPDSTYLRGTEALDLQSFRIIEARSLADLANRLGKETEADEWEKLASRLSEKLNSLFWDEETQYYYSVDAREGDFTFKKSEDLKYRTLTGMLPLSASVADTGQAEVLKADLADKDRFNLKYGVPFMAADDPDYAQWDHAFTSGEWWEFLFDGASEYGWEIRAESLSSKIEDQLIHVLADQHEFPYHYSAAWPSANKGKASLHTVIALNILNKASTLKSSTEIVSGSKSERPQKWTLGQNYPNPFNPVTVIPVSLDSRREIKLEVYDRIGRRVQTIAKGTFTRGRHNFRFNAENLSSGIYIYKLTIDGSVKSGVMTLIK